jgi:cell wall-associated protease
MKSLRFLLALALTACASGRTVTNETPTPAPAPATSSPTPSQPANTPAPPPPAALTEAPRDWQLLDIATDRVVGVSAKRAERELLASKKPTRTVTVAVIDGGIDTAHVGLKANLWTNSKEVAGNGRDDDNNGYADDVHGWNFIGGKDGKNVHHETLEVTRLYARCTKAVEGTSAAKLPVPDAATCKRVTEEFEKERAETQQLGQQVTQISTVMTRANDVLRRAIGDSLTKAKVTAFQPTSTETQQAKMMWLRLDEAGISPEALKEAEEEFESKSKYGLNPQYDSRSLVGDDYANTSERRYGNANVMGPDAKHGTHVAGIIGAVRGTQGGIDGIAPNVKLMMIRTVPDGDERDKDVANAIRYAVDNGAQIINMSFGKGFSPEKAVVDEAVKYADSKGVLMVHAAGNDGENLAEKPSFPTPAYTTGGKPNNWIEVGASSWKPLDSLAANFSNYGKAEVDVFAPGVDIMSTVPGGGYERQSGTSMAAPVVSGVAAMLMSYFPNLSAADVKRILLQSATRYADQRVLRPGAEAGERVPFGSLSSTGGIVNAYAAVKLAEQLSTTKP